MAFSNAAIIGLLALIATIDVAQFAHQLRLERRVTLVERRNRN